MIILGIETSCDETAAAVLEKRGSYLPTGRQVHILSNVIASSAQMQAKYGGIIPEQAAREQIKSIIPVINEALEQAFPELSPCLAGRQALRFPLYASKIDAIAVTYGPGLIGSLLVGVETAKTLALTWNKPLIPVNHLLGHFWANWIETGSRVKGQGSRKKTPSLLTLATSHLPNFPCIGLLVSGGHTDLVLFKDEQNYEYLGGTRDDAAGECFDKCARLLGLPYPGGPEISKLASQGDALRFNLPRPMINSRDFDFSFSGLKTAVANLLSTSEVGFDSSEVKCDLAAGIEQAIVDVLVKKTIAAAQKYKVEHIMIAGGVAANQFLVRKLKIQSENLPAGEAGLKVKLHLPPPELCTDNAAMIASRGFFQKPIDPLKLQAEPNLALSN